MIYKWGCSCDLQGRHAAKALKYDAEEGDGNKESENEEDEVPTKVSSLVVCSRFLVILRK